VPESRASTFVDDRPLATVGVMSARDHAAYANHCATLGVRQVRTVDELNAVYRPLILRWHPDRYIGTAGHAVALERAKALNAAYGYLSAAITSEKDSNVALPMARPSGQRRVSEHGFPDASVLEIFVKPSSIISVGYNSATADLFVKYHGHRTYRYIGVPPLAFEALLLASSASAFVRDRIERQYTYEAL